MSTWLKISLLSALLMVISATIGFSQEIYELEPGLHEINVMGQHFEVETEARIELVFDFVDEVRVTGSIVVLDPPWVGYVRLTWLEYGVHIVGEEVEGSKEFDYTSSETGHAERKTAPKLPNIPASPLGH